jgi:hypothetical protein
MKVIAGSKVALIVRIARRCREEVDSRAVRTHVRLLYNAEAVRIR